MKPSENSNGSPNDDLQQDQVEFSVIDGDFSCGTYPNAMNRGTLIDLDPSGIGMLTHIPLQPGNIVKFDHGGTSKLGIVMWSVESSNRFRIQVRFL